MTYAAKAEQRKTEADQVLRDSASHAGIRLVVNRAAARYKMDFSRLANLDKMFRWFFPLCYFIYVVTMFSLNPSYGGATSCDFERF